MIQLTYQEGLGAFHLDEHICQDWPQYKFSCPPTQHKLYTSLYNNLMLMLISFCLAIKKYITLWASV